MSTPRSNLAEASERYPTLLPLLLVVAGKKYAPSRAIFLVLSSTSELLPPKTPPRHTGASFVAISTESVVNSRSTSSRVTIFSPSS